MNKDFKRLISLVMFVLLLATAILGLTIPASGEGGSKRLKELDPGAIVEFAGQDWIVLDPETGYVLRKEALPYELNIRPDGYIYHSLESWESVYPNLNIAAYLNESNYMYESKTDGIGFLEGLSGNYPWEAGKILPHRWSNGTELDDRVGLSYYSFKVGLLSYSEYQQYKDLLQAYPADRNWWLRTFCEDKTFHIWYVTPEGTLSSAHMYNDIGQVPRPAMNIDPYVIATYGGDGYVINEENQAQTLPMKAAPVIAGSPFAGYTSAVASPSQAGGSLALSISPDELTVPANFSDAPTGGDVIKPYISSSLINAQAGNYIGIYDLNKDGLVIGFNQIHLSSDDFGDISDSIAVISPNGGGPFNVAEPRTVTMTVPMGYTAYYTTDGSDPQDSATKTQYTQGFSVGQSTTVKARCTDDTSWSEPSEVFFSFHSDLSPVVAAFNPAAPSDIRIAMRPYGNTLTAIKQGDSILTQGTDYTLSGNEADITKEYLAAQPGPVSLTFYFSEGDPVTITVPRVGGDYQDSTVTPADIQPLKIPKMFDKNPDGEYHEDIRLNIACNGNDLLCIRNGSNPLKSGADYSIDGATVTIFASYLARQSPVNLSFDFDAGETAATVDVQLTITDTRNLPSQNNLRFSLDEDENRYFLLSGDYQRIYVKAAKDQFKWGRQVEAGKTYILAGSGEAEGYTGDGGPAINARLGFYLNYNQILTDREGNVYFMNYVDPSDFVGPRRVVVRMIPAANCSRFGIENMQAGYIYTIIGGGEGAFTAAGGDNARDFNFTKGFYSIAVDRSYNLYFTEFGSHVVARVDAATGAVTTVIGTGTHGAPVEGALATETKLILSAQDYIKVDDAGNIYLVYGTQMFMVPAVDMYRFNKSMQAGHIYEITGYIYEIGKSYSFGACRGLAVDENGNLYIAFHVNSVVMVLMAQDQMLYGVNRTAGQYYVLHNDANRPIDLFLDSNGELYFLTNNPDAQKLKTPDNTAALTGFLGLELENSEDIDIDVIVNNVPKLVERDGVLYWRSMVYPSEFSTLASGSKVIFYNENPANITEEYALPGSLYIYHTGYIYLKVVSKDGTKTEHYRVKLNFPDLWSPESGVVTTVLDQPVNATIADEWIRAAEPINVPYTADKLRNADIKVLLDDDRIAVNRENGSDYPSDSVDLAVGDNNLSFYVYCWDYIRYTYEMNIHRAAEDVSLEGLEITSPPAKTFYLVGESLDLTGLVVSGLYSDDHPVVLPHSALQFSGFDSSAHIIAQEVTVTYQGMTASFRVYIIEQPVSIAITTPATKLEYLAGDPLDITGMVVTATFSDGTTETLPISAANVSGFDSSIPTESQTLTVTVGEQTAAYTIKILDPALTVIPITTVDDLDKVRTKPARRYILTNDISLGGRSWDPFDFVGSFDGNGYTIYNFSINKSGSNNIGFFSTIAVNASVMNLTLEQYVVSGKENVGGLAGVNHGTINNCSVKGSVTSSSHNTGGLVGYNYGIIENSNATGSVTGGNSNNVGGLVGYNKGGRITGCYASGDVYSNYVRVGGLVGLNEGGIITMSYATGNVTSNQNIVGGLAGANFSNGTIADCYATGSVTSLTNAGVGGLVGENTNSELDTSSITNCYAVGAVSRSAGSLGGLVAKNIYDGPISDSYYNTDTCGEDADNGIGEGKTTIELMQQATFDGWDFAEGGIWRIAEGTDYPVLQWQLALPVINTTTLAGGTVGTPYSQTLTATGGGSITWSLDSGNLPDGLSLTDNSISGTPTAAGTFAFAVKATNEAGSATKELSIVISEATLESIAITTPADKLVYTVGESLDITGMVVTGTYSDGSTKVETITEANVSGFDSSAPAENQVLTVTVGDKTTTYEVQIVEQQIDECFIASAAFGSKFDWPVALLRDFRDQYLLTNSPGKAFVSFYYHNSPQIAAIIAGSQPLKILVCILLVPVIALVYIIYHPLILLVVLFLLIALFAVHRSRLLRRYV